MRIPLGCGAGEDVDLGLDGDAPKRVRVAPVLEGDTGLELALESSAELARVELFRGPDDVPPELGGRGRPRCAVELGRSPGSDRVEQVCWNRNSCSPSIELGHYVLGT